MMRRWGLRNEHRTLNIHGQTCTINTAEQILTLQINEAFYSAGKKLNWYYDNPVGVGVNPAIFGYCINNRLQLKIELEGYGYIISNPSKIYRLCKINRWHWKCGNTYLMIVPLQLLK